MVMRRYHPTWFVRDYTEDEIDRELQWVRKRLIAMSVQGLNQTFDYKMTLAIYHEILQEIRFRHECDEREARK